MKKFVIIGAVMLSVIFFTLNYKKQIDVLNNDIYYLKQYVKNEFAKKIDVFNSDSFYNCTDTCYKYLSERIKIPQTVLYLSKNQCLNCGIYEYNLLKQMQPVANNVLILVSFKRDRDAILWIERNQVDYPVYNYKGYMVNKSENFFFILDSTFVAQHTLQPLATIPEFTVTCLKILLEKAKSIE